MLRRLMGLIRGRWHPLWRARQFPVYRRFQNRFDCTVYTQIPETNIKVAVKLLRDGSWIINPAVLELEIRAAFALVLDLLKPAVFWDVGANIGFYSWFVRQRSSVRQVVMFEPDPTNYGLIMRTIQRNAISDCTALNIALADCDGDSTFLVDRASGACGSLEAVSQRRDEHSMQYAYQTTETATCRTATVDDLIAGGVPPPELIKIDVEGAEHLVLAGAESCLARQRPALIIETSSGDLVRKLRGSGYTVFRIDAHNLLFLSVMPGVDLTLVRRTLSEYSYVAQPGFSLHEALAISLLCV
jgi:FkbM family methyltransferase